MNRILSIFQRRWLNYTFFLYLQVVSFQYKSIQKQIRLRMWRFVRFFGSKLSHFSVLYFPNVCVDGNGFLIVLVTFIENKVVFFLCVTNRLAHIIWRREVNQSESGDLRTKKKHKLNTFHDWWNVQTQKRHFKSTCKISLLPVWQLNNRNLKFNSVFSDSGGHIKTDYWHTEYSVNFKRGCITHCDSWLQCCSRKVQRLCVFHSTILICVIFIWYNECIYAVVRSHLFI